MIITDKTTSILKQEINDILEGLQKRAPTFSFRKIIQPLLKNNSLLSGRGWLEIKEKYNEFAGIDEKTTTETLNEHKKKLLNIYKKSIIFGSSGLMIYKIENSIIEEIEKSIETDKESLFFKNFPYPLSEDELKKIPNGESQLVKIKSDDDFLSLIFCYRRVYKEKETIDASVITNVSLEYSEIYGVKAGYTQAYDKVIFDKKTGYVYFCIDKCIEQNITSQEISFKTSEYIRFITKKTKLETNAFQKPENFFPLIQDFYNEEDGIVTELNHITSTNSKKNEKMTTGYPEDLRNELFHKGGLKEVTNTDIYLIEKKWPSPYDIGLPTILLPGQATQIYSSNPQLNYALISGHCFLSDFKFLLEKLNKKEDEILK